MSDIIFTPKFTSCSTLS